MYYLVAKYILTAGMIVLISEVAKRYDRVSAIIASPSAHHDTHDDLDVYRAYANDKNLQSCVLHFLVRYTDASHVSRFSVSLGKIQFLNSTRHFPRFDDSSLSLIRDDASVFRYSPPLKIVRKILSLILTVSLGFLPYMPLMHAEESHAIPDSHHMEESHCCHDCQENPEHNMQGCIDAVHDILGYSSVNFPHAPEIVVAIFPYWTLENHREENTYETRYARSQDPPWQFGENYIGIVKLTI